jgi:hypothetical protein
MKVSIISVEGQLEAITGHTSEVTIGRTADTTALYLENPLLPIDENLLCINSSLAIQNYLLNPKIKSAVNMHLGLTGEIGKSSLYAFFNGETFSDWLEVSFSTRFMAGNVGPDIGFATGVGLRCDSEVYAAVPQLGEIKKFLKESSYRGEVLLSITEDFRITNMLFGHFHGHFALYTELSQLGKADGILEFLVGNQLACELGSNIGVANLVTLPPFPLQLPGLKVRNILAPQSAEKHLWRVRAGLLQTVVVSVRGLYLLEARRRMRKTMDNMSKYSPDIQYRIDYGSNYSTFVICAERFKELAMKKSEFFSRPAQAPSQEKNQDQTA